MLLLQYRFVYTSRLVHAAAAGVELLGRHANVPAQLQSHVIVRSEAPYLLRQLHALTLAWHTLAWKPCLLCGA